MSCDLTPWHWTPQLQACYSCYVVQVTWTKCISIYKSMSDQKQDTYIQMLVWLLWWRWLLTLSQWLFAKDSEHSFTVNNLLAENFLHNLLCFSLDDLGLPTNDAVFLSHWHISTAHTCCSDVTVGGLFIPQMLGAWSTQFISVVILFIHECLMEIWKLAFKKPIVILRGWSA